jgi:hypothetical protein
MDLKINNTFDRFRDHINDLRKELGQQGRNPWVAPRIEAPYFSPDRRTIYQYFTFQGQGIPEDPHYWLVAWGFHFPGGAWEAELPGAARPLHHAFLEIGPDEGRLPLELLDNFPIDPWRPTLDKTELWWPKPLNIPDDPDDPGEQLIADLASWVGEGTRSAGPIIRRLRGIE